MSDYEFSDQDDYYDEDEEMDVQDDGKSCVDHSVVRSDNVWQVLLSQRKKTT